MYNSKLITIFDTSKQYNNMSLFIIALILGFKVGRSRVDYLTDSISIYTKGECLDITYEGLTFVAVHKEIEVIKTKNFNCLINEVEKWVNYQYL